MHLLFLRGNSCCLREIIIFFVAAILHTTSGLAINNNTDKHVANTNHNTRPVLASTCHALQDAARNGIVIRGTRTKGLGAFAGESIQSGAWIGEYKGEILTKREVEVRYWDKRKHRKTADRRWKKSRVHRQQGLSGDYLFDMGDNLFLDGEDADISSWCRFMNHAPEVSSNTVDGHPTSNCHCNVETKWSSLLIDITDNEKVTQPRLWFVARRDIEIGEELLYDYGDSYW